MQKFISLHKSFLNKAVKNNVYIHAHSKLFWETICEKIISFTFSFFFNCRSAKCWIPQTFRRWVAFAGKKYSAGKHQQWKSAMIKADCDITSLEIFIRVVKCRISLFFVRWIIDFKTITHTVIVSYSHWNYPWLNFGNIYGIFWSNYFVFLMLKSWFLFMRSAQPSFLTEVTIMLGDY